MPSNQSGEPGFPLVPPGFRSDSLQPDKREREEAVLLINNHRLAMGKAMKTKGFGYEEVNAVLSDVIRTRNPLSPGLIIALLCENHDINFSIRPKVRGLFSKKESGGRRNDTIVQATLRCNLDVFQLLIEDADTQTLNTALQVAIGNNIADKADVCFRRGASLPQDPWFDGTEFVRDLVQKQQTLLLKTVLQHCAISSSTFAVAMQTSMALTNTDAISELAGVLVLAQPDQLAISQALISAVERAAYTNLESRYLKLIRVLLEKGNADVDFEDGKCMKRAAEVGQTQILDCLLEHSASIQSLNDILAHSMKFSQIGPTDSILRSISTAEIQISTVPSHQASPIPGIASTSQCQLSQDTKRIHPSVVGHDLLKSASKGDALSCQKLLDLLRESKSKLDVSDFTAITGELLLLGAQSGTWLPSKTLEVLSYLLARGITSREIDAGFCKTLSYPMLTDRMDAAVLLAHATRTETFNVALDVAKLKVESDNDLWRIHSLVEWGANGESIHLAFCLAIIFNQHRHDRLANDCIRTLLIPSLDVNDHDGECLQVAVEYGNTDILEELAAKANARSKSIAFSAVILASHEEHILLNMLNILNLNMRGSANVPEIFHGHFPHLFVCLQLYPNCPKLVQRLIEEGCSVDAQIEYCTYADHLPREEFVTVLVWALCQLARKIPSDVILVLLEYCDVNFQTTHSMVTPLILAARTQRHDIISALLAKNARPSPKDKWGHSALFYASRHGKIDSVNALIKANASVNDGSLHEAARELHADVVAALISAKHDINFTSANKDHDFRTALHELLLKCDGRKGGISRIEETIRALTKNKPLTKDDFFLALNNPRPIPLIGALRNCGMYETISSIVQEISVDAEFVYYYSPTMYVHLGLTYGPLDQRNELIGELKKIGVKDQFYAEREPRQPANSIGAPAVQEYRDHVRIQQNLRAEADRKRAWIDSQAQKGAVIARKAFGDIRKQQHTRNFYIQSGDASARRERHMQDLITRRRRLFLDSIKVFSEREKKIAGWDSLVINP